MARLNLGDRIPNVSLTSTSGELFDFDEQRKNSDNWQLLVFFRGQW